MENDALFAVICMIYGVIGGFVLAVLYGIVSGVERLLKRKRNRYVVRDWSKK